MKKTILTVGILTTIAVPIATVVSCSSDEIDHEKQAREDNKIKMEEERILEKVFERFKEYNPKPALRLLPSSIKTFNKDALFKLFDIKDAELLSEGFKSVTFKNINYIAYDGEGKAEIKFDIVVGHSTTHFERSLYGTFKDGFFLSSREKTELYLKKLSGFRFKTSLIDKTTQKAPTFNEFIGNDPRGFGSSRGVWSTDKFWNNKGKQGWSIEQYKEYVGFDIHDTQKTFEGKTYADWFNDVKLIDISDYDIAQEGVKKVTPFPVKIGNYGEIISPRVDEKMETWPGSTGEVLISPVEIANGAERIRLTLEKDGVTVSINTYVYGFSSPSN